jgi:three-Cys-motif partner protein
MAVPTGTLWERDPHTAAKHTLLRRYMAAWFPIMASRFKDVGITFLDGFAGPGEYLNSTESSPAIACLQATRQDVWGHGTPLRLLFIEERQDRAAHLNHVLSHLLPADNRPPNVEVTIRHGDCVSGYATALQEVGGWSGPIFANLDGWGVDTPHSLVAHIASRPSSEVLVTFQDSFFVRFADVEDVEAGDIVFGNRDWRRVGQQPTSSKRSFLLKLYSERLRAAGFEHVLTFEMVDEGGHALYQFFGTNSLLAVERFKDGLWEVDGVNGQRFRDPRDVNQLAFAMNDPDFTSLEREIIRLVSDAGKIDVQTLCEHALRHTIYKKTHVKPTVDRLAENGKIRRVSTGRSFAEKVYELGTPTLF